MPSSRTHRKQTDKRRKWFKLRSRKKSLQMNSVTDNGNITIQLDTNTTCTELMRKYIENISSMNIAEFPSVIKEAAREENVLVQTTVLDACLQRILHCLDTESGSRKPRLEQVRVLRRLIFGKGDTLLIARTGFGKSIIFHSFSILTGKKTLQIVPLSKLGDEQLNDIHKLPGANPCLITHET